MSPFARIARWSFRHRGVALALWVVALVAATGLSSAAGTAWVNDFALPGTESQRALDVLEREFPRHAGDSAQVVFAAPAGIEAERERAQALLAELGRMEHVASVSDLTVAQGGRIAYATVTLDALASDIPIEDVRTIVEAAQAGGGDGLRVEVGGPPADVAAEGEGGPAEAVGLLVALVVLFVVFGSALAAGLPVVVALLAIGITTGVVGLAAHVIDIADYSPIIATLIGIGVGIDYALLVLSRYRAELHAGEPRETAVRNAMDTAGRTVFFAGCTVIIALMGLLALGMASLQGPAFAAGIAVLVTMLATLTLLPALLAFAGSRLERRRRRSRPDRCRWERWSAFVQRRPWPVAIASVALLLAMAAPALDMRLGFADAGTASEAKTTRQAYDLLAEGFGPGANGPLLVVVEGGAGGAAQERLAAVPGVASVSPPTPSEDGSVALFTVVPASAPQSEATGEVVERLRALDLPLLVGGAKAASLDFADVIGDKMPVFAAIVVGLSALLLLVVFRSVLLPLKAALLNLLSIGASLGVITLVFQEGLLGTPEGPIEAFVPVMLFAIVFGLSMDYEVFLLSRVHEEWERTGDSRLAVRRGLAITGRIITAAAAIMVAVFASFVLMDDRMIQMFGLGLAVAILVDAVVIRCLLVPAVMSLLGRASWWLPAWLDRRLPRVALERGTG